MEKIFDFNERVRLNFDITKGGLDVMKIMSTNCVIEQLQLEHFTDIHKLYSNKQVRTYLGGVPSNSYIEASFKAC